MHILTIIFTTKTKARSLLFFMPLPFVVKFKPKLSQSTACFHTHKLANALTVSKNSAIYRFFINDAGLLTNVETLVLSVATFHLHQLTYQPDESPTPKRFQHDLSFQINLLEAD